MELTGSITHKRPQSYDCAAPSISHPSTLAYGVDAFQQFSLDFQPAIDQQCLPYGQTSGFESHNHPEPQHAPSKRRKLDYRCDTMPQKYSFLPHQSALEKAPALDQYDLSANEQQFLSAGWPEPIITPSQTLAYFPRRMAEIFCNGCDFTTGHLDGYHTLPQGPDASYSLNQPYIAEKQPVVASQALPGTSTLPYVEAGAGSAAYEFVPAQVASSLDTFSHAVELQTSEFFQDGFLPEHNANFSAFFTDQVLKPETGLIGPLPIPDQSGLMLSASCQDNYGFGTFVAAGSPSGQGIGSSMLSSDGSGILMVTGSLVETLPQQSWVDTSSNAHQTSFDIILPNQRGGKRGPFKDPTLREQTAQTRKIGSCIRCRMQRIRCEHNPEEPGGACLTCKKVSNVKAGRFPCLRYKITDIRLFKPGQVPGYEWTRRWNNNISDPIQKWASAEVKFIRISSGFTKKCIQLPVRKFIPQDGDKTERTWDYNGSKRSVKVPPYALMDLEDGKTAYMRHISDAMGDTIKHIADRSSGLLRKTYVEAFRMYQDATIPEEWKQLLDWTFRLWVAVRLSTNSDFIVGEEKLGMADDILDATSPNAGKIPVPPVLGAQLDLVLIHHIQTRLRRELLDKLQKMVLKNRQCTWFVTYLVTFILLHNAALIIAHDAAYARKHGIRRRFAREDKVKEYHLGANILLAHFHYCNKGWYPFSDECKDQDLRSLADLDEEKIRFVHETRKFAKEHEREWEQVREKGAWEHDYFFVSQLFQENWHPRTES